MIASRYSHVHEARTGHVTVARRRTAWAPAVTVPVVWQKATVSGPCAAMPAFLGIDATARRPKEASP